MKGKVRTRRYGATGGEMSKQITAFREVNVMGFEGPRNGGNAGQNFPPGRTQEVGWRVKINCTPEPDDKAYNRSLVMEDGHSPCLLWRWGYEEDGGKDVYCSKGGDGQPDAQQDREDPFDLQSYEWKNENDTAGPFAIALELTAPLGPGVKRAWAYPILWAGPNGQYNGGVTAKGQRTYWKCD